MKGSAPPLQRVVWVEDDASLQALIRMVLEDEPVELVLCASVCEALAALRQQPAALVVTDLMLINESGMDLLAHLAAEPALRGKARLAVLSAGLDAALENRMFELGVWRVMAKPASVAALSACVHDALSEAPIAIAPVQPAAAGDAPADRFFGGDHSLYQAYRQSCMAQFPVDIRLGDAALAAGDLVALRRLAHSLRSVLATLGHDGQAELAAAVERDSATFAHAGATPGWRLLRAALASLGQAPDTPSPP